MQRFAVWKALSDMTGLTTTGPVTAALRLAVDGDEAAFTQIVPLTSGT